MSGSYRIVSSAGKTQIYGPDGALVKDAVSLTVCAEFGVVRAEITLLAINPVIELDVPADHVALGQRALTDKDAAP